MVMQIPPPESLKLNFVLEQTADGRSLARVMELPDCQVEASTDEQAIAQLQDILTQRFAKARILPFEIPLELPSEPPIRENPWLEFIGMFKGDKDFAAIAAELRAEREIDSEDMA
jgi:predicted RNase H-like HicB family nuclease